MKKLRIVLLGDHGGELDSKPFEVRPEQEEDGVIKNAVISAVEDWTLSIGDNIKIEEVL